MRKVELMVRLRFVVDSLESITAPGGPKEILQGYVDSQPAGSELTIDYMERPNEENPRVMTAKMFFVVADRGATAVVMNQIDNNLDVLPTLVGLVYQYREDEIPE